MTRPQWLMPPVLGVGDQVQVAGWWPTNAAMVEDCARLYWPDPGTVEVLDATWGKGRFWTPRMLDAYQPTRNDQHTPADTAHDFRDLPPTWADRFGVTIFDPDYTVRGTRTGHSFEAMNAAYGLLRSPRCPEELLDANRAGLTEVVRVTSPGGVVCVKYADQVDSGRHVPGVFMMQTHAATLDLVPLRRLVFTTRTARAQPPRTTGPDRVPAVQRTPAQNTSELLIYRRP